jgi:hypothetical protein
MPALPPKKSKGNKIKTNLWIFGGGAGGGGLWQEIEIVTLLRNRESNRVLLASVQLY